MPVLDLLGPPRQTRLALAPPLKPQVISHFLKPFTICQISAFQFPLAATREGQAVPFPSRAPCVRGFRRHYFLFREPPRTAPLIVGLFSFSPFFPESSGLRYLYFFNTRVFFFEFRQSIAAQFSRAYSLRGRVFFLDSGTLFSSSRFPPRLPFQRSSALSPLDDFSWCRRSSFARKGNLFPSFSRGLNFPFLKIFFF